MITLPIYNIQAEQVDSVNLEPKIFDGRINYGPMYQAVVMYRANKRKGLASTKTRGEVSGGGSKPWRQKGTGRARVGSIRSPLWRSGGVVFGPHPRSYCYTLPKKIKLQALRSSLNAKLVEKAITVLDKIEISQPKTKEIIKILSRFKDLSAQGKRKKSLLFLLDHIDEKINLATHNLNYIDICLATEANAYQILKAKELILTRQALSQLIKRLNSNKTTKLKATKKID